VGPGSTRRRVIAVVALALLATAAAVAVLQRREIVAYFTLRKGEPAVTVAYEPHVPPPDVRIAVAGNPGEAGDPLRAVAAAAAQVSSSDAFDVLLLLGDNVYPSGDPEGLPATVFEPFAPVLDGGAELLAVLGNHDVEAGHAGAQLRTLGVSGRWWSRTAGSVLMVGLDSTRPDDSEQREFLERTLRESDAAWKIVALHHPPYSAGYAGSDDDVREAFVPLFEEYGVQLVLAGHSHDYQRSVPMNGVTYVVSGAASKRDRTGEKDFTAESFSTYHFLDVAVYSDRLIVRAVDREVRVADEVVLTRSSR
jgi:3',5'-cyclic AMP phosphodiesterase CpdA